MKKIYTILVAIMLTASVFAQAPDKMTYQAVVRDNNSTLITSTQVGIEINIYQTTASGTLVYTESQTPTTNINGLLSIEIGGQTGFDLIDWAIGPYFIETNIDVAGGTNYTITGVSQLLTVPYALHAKTAETITGGISEIDPTFTSSEANNITATDITNLSNLSNTNTGDQDLSLLATQTALEDTATAIRADYPDVSGFVSTEADPVFTAWDKTTGINITESQITDLVHFTNANETDPVYTAWNKDYASLINQPTTITVAQATEITNNTAKNTYPIADATKLAGIEALAEVNVNADWNATTGDAEILNKPDLNVYLDNTDDQTLSEVLTQSNTAGTQIKNVTNPTDAQDAATKAYVDVLEQQIEEMQNALINTGTLFKDIDGNIYGAVTIGTQIWMSENLKTTKYNDGTDIPNVIDNTQWGNLITPAYCWQNNDVGNKYVYGALYNWYTIETTNLCPSGWHVPTKVEWTTLTDFLGGATVAGGKLKEIGISHWNSPNTGATNESGFTALPGGVRTSTGNFQSIGTWGYFWSATEANTTSSWLLTLYNGNANVNPADANLKEMGYSVRCLKD